MPSKQEFSLEAVVGVMFRERAADSRKAFEVVTFIAGSDGDSVFEQISAREALVVWDRIKGELVRQHPWLGKIEPPAPSRGDAAFDIWLKELKGQHGGTIMIGRAPVRIEATREEVEAFMAAEERTRSGGERPGRMQGGRRPRPGKDLKNG